MDLGESFVEPWGLAGDRRWLLVDRKGRFISQREKPSLARVVVQPCGGGISVSADGRAGPTITPPPAGAPLLTVTVWRSTLLAAAAGPKADAWFSAFLGRPVRLVYLDDPTRRPVDPQYGRQGDVVSFADGYPLLLTSTGSLGELGDWLTAARQAPVPMTRFRPSVVVGPEPRPGRKTAGAASASARSRSAWPSPAGGASSPPPTRSPASAASSRSRCSASGDASEMSSSSART